MNQAGHTELMQDQPAGVKRELHIEIDEAIGVMDARITQLNNLLDRIRGAGTEACDKVACPVGIPTLSSFLKNAEGNIRGKCENMSQLIAEIEDELF